MQNLCLLEFLAEAFWCHVRSSIENDAHGTEKPMIKTQVSENFA